ncbi:MAG: tryptophan halogenase [Caulobacter sp.]|nr:tryptophan halogenase [Caulobacter sp.]
MSAPVPRTVVILGGGVAGWMAAAALARALPAAVLRVVETAADAPRGALSTLPALRAFHARLGLDEAALMRTARGTFKLGTRFSGWMATDHVEGFSDAGANLEGVAFHHHWLRARALGPTEPFDAYSLAATAGRLGRFAYPSEDPRSVLSTLSYGLHLDAAGYVTALRASAGTVRRGPGELGDIERSPDGRIAALILADGERVAADLFVDTTAEGRLIGAALGVAWTDWSAWLPCDRLAVREVAPRANPPALTEIEAIPEGWLRRTPLRGGDAVMLAYDAALTSDDQAREILGGEAAMRPLRNGRRERAWLGNCVAIGPAAGEIEALNGVDGHLAQSGVSKLIALLPGPDGAPLAEAEYNRLIGEEQDRIRDMAVLRYAVGTRVDPPWARARQAPVPEKLAYKRAQFESRGRVVLYDEETFMDGAWAEAFIGHGILPRRHDRLADRLPAARVGETLARLRRLIVQAAQAMPPHADALKDPA